MSRGLKSILPILSLIGLALIARVIFALNLRMIDGDSAVFGLMAKHILEAKEFPIYMPMLHYAGSISSYLGAALFALFGVSVTVYNFVGALFSFSGVILCYYMIKDSLDQRGVIAAVAVSAFPFYQLLLQSFFTGIRAESFIFIPLILFFLISWRKRADKSTGSSTAWIGLVSGVGLWVTPGAIPAILAVFTVMAIDRNNINYRKSVLWFIAGLIVGYAPGIVYNFQHPSASLFRMMGKLLDVDWRLMTASDPAGIITRKILLKVSAMPILAWKMPGVIMALVGIPCGILFIGGGALVLKEHVFKKNGGAGTWNIVGIYFIYYSIYYIAIIGQSDIKYAIPLCLVSPLFIGYLISRIGRTCRLLSAALLAIILMYNCYTVANWFLYENEDRYSKVADLLVSKDLRYGFSHYSPAYILQFETNEKSTISPTLFHPTYCDRYPVDTVRVRSAPDMFYIVDKYLYPGVGMLLEAKFKKSGVVYKKDVVNGFEIYYELSQKVYPEEFSLPNVYEAN